MKYLLACLLIPFAVSAEPVTIDKKILCDQKSVIIEVLVKGEYKESPFWIGVDDNTRFAIFANEKTKSWTIIEYTDVIACVIGSGTKHTPITLGVRS